MVDKTLYICLSGRNHIVSLAAETIVFASLFLKEGETPVHSMHCDSKKKEPAQSHEVERRLDIRMSGSTG